MATTTAKTKNASEKPAWPLARPDYASLEAAVQGEAARWNVPGMSVAVLHDGVIDTVGVGFASIDTKQPVTPETIFQIGSISKVFTTTLAMMLVDEGKLDLDKPVIEYVPELPLADAETRGNLTLRHIFSHSGGFEGDTFTDTGRGDDAATKAVAAFGELKQWFPLGGLFSYNNNGFVLAGVAIERVTGQPFEDVMVERLLKPLGLESSVFFAENAITYPHAVGHYLNKREEGPKVARPYALPRQVNAAGGIIATASDLIRFAQLHINGGELDGTRLLSEELTTLMQQPRINSWDEHTSFGQGWYITEYPDLRIIQHGGSTMGFRAMLRIAPERGFAIALLTNGDSGARAYDSVTNWALEHYLGFETPVPAVADLSGKKLDRLTGLYGRQDTRMEVRRDGRTLRIRAYQIDPETGEEKEDSPYAASGDIVLEPIESPRPHDFRVKDGPMADAIIDFPPAPLADNPDRHVLRFGGRLAELLEPIESDSAKSGKKDKKDKKKKGKKK